MHHLSRNVLLDEHDQSVDTKPLELSMISQVDHYNNDEESELTWRFLSLRIVITMLTGQGLSYIFPISKFTSE